MIWIASYPRSGNTFVRNLLFQVYGIQSSEYHDEDSQLVYKDLQKYPFVKTHFLPGQLPKKWSSFPSIYIVRDGRDCVVSEAHYRQQLQGSEASYEFDLQRCITAKEGTHFGGWSTNVRQWLKKADVVLQFENLIKDPITEMEKIREIYDLPEPNLNNIPSFESQRQNAALYHGNKESSKGFEHLENLPALFYRRGEVNAWKNEMPWKLQVMYWELHGATMEQMGYSKEGHLNQAIFTKEQPASSNKFAVMLDISTTDKGRMDSTKRYEDTLKKGLVQLLRQETLPFEFFLKGDKVEKLHIPNDYDAIGSGHAQEKNKGVAFSRNVFNTILGTARRSIKHENYHHFQRFCQVTGLKAAYQFITGHMTKIELSAHSQRYLIHHLSPKVKTVNEKSLTTIHDLASLGPHANSSEKVFFEEICKRSNLLSISQQVKRDLDTHFPEQELLHKVVYSGVDHEEFLPVVDKDHSNILSQYGLKHQQYLLLWCSSGHKVHLLNYIAAFLRLVEGDKFPNHHVVLAGKHEWGEGDAPQHESIKHIGYVPQEHLTSLYHGALLLCYASHKGFGMPILEAMRCNTVPLYGDNSTVKEFLGTHGLATNPDNIEDIYMKVKNILEDSKQRASMEKACYLKSWDFTLEKMTRQTLNVYKEFL